jgi:hypothetical protein
MIVLGHHPDWIATPTAVNSTGCVRAWEQLGRFFRKPPFLKHLPETVAKVGIRFLKGHTSSTKSAPPAVNKAQRRCVALFQKWAFS